MTRNSTTVAKAIDVRYVANLARLDLTEAEVAEFQGQLDHILAYFDQLRGLDVDGVEPTAHAATIQNVFRADEPRPGLDRETVLNNAPAHSSDLIKVPTIVE